MLATDVHSCLSVSSPTAGFALKIWNQLERLLPTNLHGTVPQTANKDYPELIVSQILFVVVVVCFVFFNLGTSSQVLF